jgi:hypothetical protein
MLSTVMDAGNASQRVGYLSLSQFSRNTTASSAVHRPKTSPDCVKRLDFSSDLFQLEHHVEHPRSRESRCW